MKLEEKIASIETVERGRCRDCGNAWWFDHSNCWECTTCGKAHGKSGSEEDEWKKKNP